MRKREQFQQDIERYPEVPDQETIDLWRDHGRPRYEGRPEIEIIPPPSVWHMTALVVLASVAMITGLAAFILAL